MENSINNSSIFKTLTLIAAGLMISPSAFSDSSAVQISAKNITTGAANNQLIAVDGSYATKQLRQSQSEGFYPPENPEAHLIKRVEGREIMQSIDRLVAHRFSKSVTDCEVNFNDPEALSQFPDAAISTFAPEPWWNQECDADNLAFVRPFNLDHFHLDFENATCYELGWPGEMQEDGSCEIFENPEQQPRRLHTMLTNDIIELTVLDNGGNKVTFDFKRIRIVGNESVRVCYKPEQEINGPWIVQSPGEGTGPGIWSCWNNMSTGYWDVSTWAGNVTAVRLIGVDGIPNFMVDDIRIGIY
ncbi:MAG: hypothetical protein H6936_11060 [Burkholderiales bacterium]|nr:hypothetical protein [Nitrosomonas sp.]MCP5275366.1 hypothetical protein [Burkholderiales bacterium]